MESYESEHRVRLQKIHNKRPSDTRKPITNEGIPKYIKGIR